MPDEAQRPSAEEVGQALRALSEWMLKHGNKMPESVARALTVIALYAAHTALIEAGMLTNDLVQELYTTVESYVR